MKIEDMKDLAFTVVCNNCKTSAATFEQLSKESQGVTRDIKEKRKTLLNIIDHHEAQIKMLRDKIKITDLSLKELENQEKMLLRKNKEQEETLKQQLERYNREVEERQNVVNINMRSINDTIKKLNKNVETRQKQLHELDGEIEVTKAQIDGLKYQRNKLQ